MQKRPPEDVLTERGLPCNLDAERFVLASLLLDEALFAEAKELTPDDFSLERHRQIFTSMRDLRSDNEHIDSVTVAEDLANRGQLGHDGISYLTALDKGMPQLPHIDSYVRIVLNKSVLRRAIFANQKFINECVLETARPADIIDGHLTILHDLSQRAGQRQRYRTIGDIPLIRDCGGGEIEYLRRPELPRGAVIALTGDSGSGKSTIACAWGRDAAVPVLVLDRENPLAVINDRLRRLGISDEQRFRFWGGWLPEEAPQPDSPIVLDWVRNCEPRPLVIVDSLAGFHGGDQNDAGEMRAFMHRCRRLADLGATPLLIHHDGKAETARDYRGSSDFKAAIDMGFHVSNLGDVGRLGKLVLRPFKSRFGLSGEVVYEYADGRLTRAESADARQAVTDQLVSLLRTNPGVSAKRFEDLANKGGLGRNRARTFLNGGILSGSIRREGGSNNTKRHFLASEDGNAA